MDVTVTNTIRSNTRGLRVVDQGAAADQIKAHALSVAQNLIVYTQPLVNEPIDVIKGHTKHEARITNCNTELGVVTVKLSDFYTGKTLGSVTLFVRIESAHPQESFD